MGIQFGNNVSQKKINKLLETANETWNKVQSAKISLCDDKKNQEFLTYLKKTYPKFAKSFPVVLEWQVLLHEYDPTAFQCFLIKYVSCANKFKTPASHICLLAEYPVFLYLAKHPNASKEELENVKKEYFGGIKNDVQDYKNYLRQAQKAEEKENHEIDAQERETLFKYLADMQAINTNANDQ